MIVMSRYNWPNCPDAVRHQIEDFLTQLRDALGDNLIGVYLHGSLALGCFNPDQSDVDLLVVTRRALPVETKRRMAELLLHCSAHPRPIEISVLSEGDLYPWRYPTPYAFHFSEDWRDKIGGQLSNGEWRKWNAERQVDDDLAVHITITRRRGICLAGRPIAEALPAVPPADYRDSIVGDFWWAKDRLQRHPVYFVLNACRVWAYLAEGLICSKDEGGEWALRARPDEFRPLVAQALDVYRGRRDQVDVAALESFADFVSEVVSSHRAETKALSPRPTAREGFVSQAMRPSQTDVDPDQLQADPNQQQPDDDHPGRRLQQRDE